MRMAEERSWPVHLGGDSHRDMSTRDRKWPTPQIAPGVHVFEGFHLEGTEVEAEAQRVQIQKESPSV